MKRASRCPGVSVKGLLLLEQHTTRRLTLSSSTTAFLPLMRMSPTAYFGTVSSKDRSLRRPGCLLRTISSACLVRIGSS